MKTYLKSSRSVWKLWKDMQFLFHTFSIVANINGTQYIPSIKHWYHLSCMMHWLSVKFTSRESVRSCDFSWTDVNLIGNQCSIQLSVYQCLYGKGSKCSCSWCLLLKNGLSTKLSLSDLSYANIILPIVLKLGRDRKIKYHQIPPEKLYLFELQNTLRIKQIKAIYFYSILLT